MGPPVGTPRIRIKNLFHNRYTLMHITQTATLKIVEVSIATRSALISLTLPPIPEIDFVRKKNVSLQL